MIRSLLPRKVTQAAAHPPRLWLVGIAAVSLVGVVLLSGCGSSSAVGAKGASSATQSAIVVEGHTCSRETQPLPMQVVVLMDGVGLDSSQRPRVEQFDPLFEDIAGAGGVFAYGVIDPTTPPLLQLRVPAAPAPVARQSNSIMNRLCRDAFTEKLRQWQTASQPEIAAFRSRLATLVVGGSSEGTDPFPSVRQARALFSELAGVGGSPHLLFISGRERTALGCPDNQGALLPELTEYSDAARQWICIGGVWHDTALLPKLPDGKVDLAAAGYVQRSAVAVPLPPDVRVFCVKAAPAIGPLDERCDEMFARVEDGVARLVAERDVAQTAGEAAR